MVSLASLVIVMVPMIIPIRIPVHRNMDLRSICLLKFFKFIQSMSIVYFLCLV